VKVAVTILAFCVTSLLALGLVMLYSSSMVMVDRRTQSEIGAHMLQMQVAWSVLGFVACMLLAALDYKFLKKVIWPAFLGSLILAALVFMPGIGISLNGAHRWIGKFGVTCQPSEFVKITLIILLAWYVDHYQRQMHTFKNGILFPGMIIGAALSLIFIEPDRGTTILMTAVCGTMLMIADIRWLHVIPLVLLLMAGLFFSILHDPMRSRRIMAWLDPDTHAAGVALQAEQAKIAIGSGGIAGLGLGDGRQKLGFLPYIHSDFIFANIGEELGFIGAGLVVLAFLVIAVCGLYIAYRARDQFGCLLAVGVSSLISYQAIINIGVVTSLLPNKGIALPFISAGGSSLVAMLMGVGILFSVARQARSGPVSVSDFVSKSNDNPFAAKAA
jgi:cell division protein FtsW